MKRKRYVKLCSLVICFVLLFNVMSYSASAKYFSDTYVGMLDREFFDAMNYVTDNGWMNGTDTTHFSPYEGITRGMFVTVLYRYSGSTSQYASNFTDVPASAYYYYPVGWANHFNIVNGTSETTFEPEAVITKEQMAVILYRYAKNIEDKIYVPISFDSISEHPDYSSVSPYAREAVRWAKTYHVFPLADNNSYISPLAQMNRAYAALYITNYSREVTGFINRDRFSFSHSGGVTFNSVYLLSNNAKNHLLNSIDNYYGESRAETADNDKDTMRTKIGSPFRGSCFGITMCTYFDKIGKIDFNTNMGEGANSMSTVGIPKDNIETVESAINYYQFLHSITDFNSRYISYTSNLPTAFDLVYNHVDLYGATPFAYYYLNSSNSSVGHAILITRITHNVNKTIYTVHAFDPNSTSLVTRTIFVVDGGLILSSSGNIDDENNKELTRIIYYPNSSCNFFDYFDLDGAHNNLNILEAESSSGAMDSNVDSIDAEVHSNSLDISDAAVLRIPYVPFIITSSSGETLSCDGLSFTGTMEVTNMTVIPNGPDFPADLLITVKNDNSFLFTPMTSGATYFSVSSPNGFSSISGSGIVSASIDFVDNTLLVDGTNMQFSAWIETFIPENEYFYIKGNNSGDFSISVEAKKINTDGLFGVLECGFSSENELTATTASIPFSENMVLDYAEINALCSDPSLQ